MTIVVNSNKDGHLPVPDCRYDIVYKQAVGAEDMFLGMGNKTPATASCEDMIVRLYQSVYTLRLRTRKMCYFMHMHTYFYR